MLFTFPSNALALDVERRIDIAVMFDSTARAWPDPLTQRHFRHFVTTAMAGFRTGKPLIQFDQMNARRCGFIFQFLDEAMPARIPDSAGKVVILHHVSRFQRLHNDRLRRDVCRHAF